jgi:hypothetical protein
MLMRGLSNAFFSFSRKTTALFSCRKQISRSLEGVTISAAKKRVGDFEQNDILLTIVVLGMLMLKIGIIEL